MPSAWLGLGPPQTGLASHGTPRPEAALRDLQTGTDHVATSSCCTRLQGLPRGMSAHGIVLHGMKKESCAAEARVTRSECPQQWASQKQAVTKERSGPSKVATKQVTARLGQQETCQEAEVALESQPRPRVAACTSRGRLEVQAQWGRGGPSPQGPCLVAYKTRCSSAWLGCVRLGVEQPETRSRIPGLSPKLSAAPPQGLQQAVVGLVSAPNFTAWCPQVSQDPGPPAGPRSRTRRPP